MERVEGTRSRQEHPRGGSIIEAEGNRVMPAKVARAQKDLQTEEGLVS